MMEINITVLNTKTTTNETVVKEFAIRKDEWDPNDVEIPAVLDKLTYAKADGTYFKFLDFIAKAKRLIIDDFGLKKVDASQCNMLLDVIDERHAKSSTIISSQLQVKEWYDCFAQKTIAEAILDRVLNSSYRILLEGEISMRKNLRKTEE